MGVKAAGFKVEGARGCPRPKHPSRFAELGIDHASDYNGGHDFRPSKLKSRRGTLKSCAGRKRIVQK
jgi:hypothetical protein